MERHHQPSGCLCFPPFLRKKQLQSRPATAGTPADIVAKADVSLAIGPTPCPGAPENKAAAAGHELAQNGGTAEHPAPAPEPEAHAPSADVTTPAAAEPDASPSRQTASADSNKVTEPDYYAMKDIAAPPTPPSGVVVSAAASPDLPVAGTTAAPSESEAASSADAEITAEAPAEAPTPKADSRALSTYSAASSTYYSASSWPHLGTDGEWLGPSLNRPPSGESLSHQLAHTVSTSSREGPGLVDPQAGVASVGGQGHSGAGLTPRSGVLPHSGVLPTATVSRVEEGPQPGPGSGSTQQPGPGSGSPQQPQGRPRGPPHEHQQRHDHHHQYQQHQEQQQPQLEHLPVLAEEGVPSERGEAVLPEAQTQQQQPLPLEQPSGTGPPAPAALVTAKSASPRCPPAAATAVTAGAAAGAAGASEDHTTGADAGPPGAATAATVVLPPVPASGTPARCSRGAADAGDKKAADNANSDNKVRGGSSSGSRGAMLDQVAELYGLRGMPCRACQAMLNYCKAQDVAPESLRPELHARQLPDAEVLTKVVQDVYDSLADMASDSGWQVVRNDELRLMYKHLPAKGVHAFRARCVLDAPTEHLVALAREVDLCPTWNKYCTSASVMCQMSLTDVLVYISLWMPWPFNSVGFLLEAFGADLYDEERCLHITLSTPDKQGNPVTLPPGSAKHRQMKMLRPSCLSITPLPPKVPGGPPRTSCAIQAYVDPGTRAVPAFIISFVLKVLSPFVYSAVKKVLATAFGAPHNPLPTRIRERPELYNLIRERTEMYLRTKETAVPPATATAGELAGTSSGRTSA